jgi:hypothetical protein
VPTITEAALIFPAGSSFPQHNTMATLTTPAKPAGRLNLAGLAKAKPAKGKDYPILPETDESKQLVAVIRTQADELDSLKGSLDIHKSEITSIALPFYFAALHGRGEIPSSVIARNGTEEVLIEFQKRFKQPDSKGGEAAFNATLEQFQAAMGDHFDRFGRFGYKFTIDGDKIPAESAPAVLEGIQKVLAAHGCDPTEVLTAKETINTTSDFHTLRHSVFTPEQNEAIHRALPLVVQVKTKGRGFRK